MIRKTFQKDVVTHSRTSIYKGVTWNKQFQTWQSSITHNKIRYECGKSKDERECAKLRDKKIIALGMPIKLLQILKPL